MSTYNIQGRVHWGNDPPAASYIGIPGVLVVASGGAATYSAYTDVTGQYSIPGVPNGTYSVTAYRVGLSWGTTVNKQTKTATVSGSDVLGLHFHPLADPYHSVAGTVTNAGLGLAGVTIQFLSATMGVFYTVTASDGTYTAYGVQNGTWAVSPSLSGYSFTPVSINVTMAGSNLTGENFTAGSSATSYVVSGTIQTGTGAKVSGVVVDVMPTTSGASPHQSAVTSGVGTYAVGLLPGTYTLTPSYQGMTFAPTSISVTVTNAAVPSQDFTATPSAGHLISGTISGLGGNIVLVQCSNPLQQAYCDGSGNYAFYGLADATYTVQPLDSRYTFAPTSLSVTLSGADATGKNFAATGTGGAYAISGTVTLNGTGLPGVLVTASDGTNSFNATTASDGTYSVGGLTNATYSLTPSLSGYAFSPALITVVVNGGNVTGQNFYASTSGGGGGTTGTYSLTVTVTASSVPLAGVLVQVGITSGTTDVLGTCVLTGFAPGSYTVYPSKSGYSFSPVTATLTFTTQNLTQAFTAVAQTGSGGGGGSTIAVPYRFTNESGSFQEAVDADKVNADFDYLADVANNVTDDNISFNAGISPTKVASSEDPPLPNLKADIVDLNARVKVLETDVSGLDVYSAWNAVLPIDQGLELGSSGAAGGGGQVTIVSGGKFAMMGHQFTVSAQTLPTGGVFNAGGLYAIRAKLDASNNLQFYTVPLAGKALGSGDVASTQHVIGSLSAVSDASTFTATGYGASSLMGAVGTILVDTGEEFFVAYELGGVIVLADALSAAPGTGTLVAFSLDDPALRDADGTLGGDSTSSDALIALVYCGQDGTAPIVHKMSNVGGSAYERGKVSQSAWTARLDVNPGTGAIQSATVQFSSSHRPPKNATVLCVMDDKNPPVQPTKLCYTVVGSFAVITDPDATTQLAKGFSVALKPGSATIRVSDGHLRMLLDSTATGTVVKGARFKLILETF